MKSSYDSTPDIMIGTRAIGRDHPPFIVAEMSGNHNQSLDRALEIVEAAASAGAHAVKLQTYTADTMTLELNEREFRIDDPESLWHGRSLYDLYAEAHTPWEWHEPIFKRAEELGIVCFSTPFDASAVEFLEGIGNPVYKVASFENTDLSLIRRVSQTGKPVIMSTGMASKGELEESIQVFRTNGVTQIVLLKCTSSYPATPEQSHLRTIPELKELFDVQVGLSDHTQGIGVALASVALGATLIEKHFTLSRAEGGVDAAFSIEPQELEALVIESQRAWQALGTVAFGAQETERRSLQFRRSVYIVDDVQAGERLTAKSIRIIRPGYGLAPKNYDRLLGMRVRSDYKRGTPLRWDMIE